MEKAAEILIEGLSALNIEPADTTVEQYMIFLTELKKWNQVYNLTAITKDKDIIIKHFLDSLLYLKFIPSGSWNICDIGSGAGFPGLPIAIVRRDLNITLLEPTKKKSSFLRHIIKTLALEKVQIIESRAEDIKGITFDIALSRALFSISELIKKAWHLVKENGFFIMNKGPGLKDEIKNIPIDINFEVIPTSLPLSSIKRNMVRIMRQ